ncbi:MAG: SMC family ATPase, partial [Desulfurobacteriaceae bacterium]
MVRLRRLELENFLSHRETELDFEDRTYVIVGENASGKTSILRGIFFALFGQDLFASSAQLINRSSNQARVCLHFVHGGRSYTVERELGKRRSSALLLRDGSLVAEGVRNVSRYISEHLGLEPTIFKNTVFVPQGEVLNLLQGRPSDKRRILNRLLGLDELEKKHEALRAFLKELKGIEERYLDRLKFYEELRSALEELERRLSFIKEDLK